MVGRRALPWSAEAEERLPVRLGRRKTPWRDRPKQFPSLDAAGTFAARRADSSRRRQRVRFDVAAGMWIVRAGTDPVRSTLRDSLDRMAREA